MLWKRYTPQGPEDGVLWLLFILLTLKKKKKVQQRREFDRILV